MFFWFANSVIMAYLAKEANATSTSAPDKQDYSSQDSLWSWSVKHKPRLYLGMLTIWLMVSFFLFS